MSYVYFARARGSHYAAMCLQGKRATCDKAFNPTCFFRRICDSLCGLDFQLQSAT